MLLFHSLRVKFTVKYQSVCTCRTLNTLPCFFFFILLFVFTLSNSLYIKVFTETVLFGQTLFLLGIIQTYFISTFKTLLKKSMHCQLWCWFEQTKKNFAKSLQANKLFKPHRIIDREIWLFIDVFKYKHPLGSVFMILCQ